MKPNEPSPLDKRIGYAADPDPRIGYWADKMTDEDMDIFMPGLCESVFNYEKRCQRVAEITDLPVHVVRQAILSHDTQGITVNTMSIFGVLYREYMKDSEPKEPWKQP